MLAALNAQCTIPFDLGAEYPLRCRILRKSAQHHYLFLTFHHCVVDGWTANLLVDELSRGYHAHEEHCHYDNGQAFSATLKTLSSPSPMSMTAWRFGAMNWMVRRKTRA